MLAISPTCILVAELIYVIRQFLKALHRKCGNNSKALFSDIQLPVQNFVKLIYFRMNMLEVIRRVFTFQSQHFLISNVKTFVLLQYFQKAYTLNTTVTELLVLLL